MQGRWHWGQKSRLPLPLEALKQRDESLLEDGPDLARHDEVKLVAGGRPGRERAAKEHWLTREISRGFQIRFVKGYCQLRGDHPDKPWAPCQHEKAGLIGQL